MLAFSRSRLLGQAAVAAALAVMSVSVAARADDATPPAAAAPADAADPVVAKVNGTAIHRSQLDIVRQTMISMNPQFGQLSSEQAYPYVVDRAIVEALVLQAATKDNVANDAKVKKSIQIATDHVLEQAYIDKSVTSGFTDAALKATYQELVKSTPPVDEVHVRHILLADKDAALAEIKKLKAGAKFEDLAKKDSKDTNSGANGGDLGFFKQEGTMVKEFADAAFKLKVGQYTETPVKTQYGYHIIKLEERRKAPVPTFEEAQQQVHQVLGQQIVQSTIKALHDSAKIEQFDANGKPLPAPAAAAAPAPAPAAPAPAAAPAKP